MPSDSGIDGLYSQAYRESGHSRHFPVDGQKDDARTLCGSMRPDIRAMVGITSASLVTVIMTVF
jgi:hypothetical protein